MDYLDRRRPKSFDYFLFRVCLCLASCFNSSVKYCCNVYYPPLSVEFCSNVHVTRACDFDTAGISLSSVIVFVFLQKKTLTRIENDHSMCHRSLSGNIFLQRLTWAVVILRYVLPMLWTTSISYNGTYGALCVLKRREDSSTAETTASISTKFCSTIETSNVGLIVGCALGTKFATYDCFV